MSGRTRSWARLAAVAAVVTALAGCAGQTDHDAIRVAMVEGKPGFAPATVTVHKGDSVDLTVRNVTDKTHGFSVAGYGIHRLSDPTAPPMHVRFSADRVGTFKVFCQLHPAHQTATLVVL
jgi:nitrosocyanin